MWKERKIIIILMLQRKMQRSTRSRSSKHRCPDVVVLDKTMKVFHLIDIAVPGDSFEEDEKKRSTSTKT